MIFFFSFDTSEAEVCTDLCKRWSNWDESSECSFNCSDIDNLSSNQVSYSLYNLFYIVKKIK